MLLYFYSMLRCSQYSLEFRGSQCKLKEMTQRCFFLGQVIELVKQQAQEIESPFLELLAAMFVILMFAIYTNINESGSINVHGAIRDFALCAGSAGAVFAAGRSISAGTYAASGKVEELDSIHVDNTK